MDQIQSLEEISCLAKQAAEYERQLKMVGIELSDMPDDCVSLLDKYAEIKLKTNLPDLSMSFLEEFYCRQMREHIKHRLNKSKIKRDIKHLEEDIEEEKRTCKILEEFIETAKSQLTSEEEMERTKLLIEKQIENLTSKREKTFKLPSDFSFEELMAKVERLEAKRKQPKSSD